MHGSKWFLIAVVALVGSRVAAQDKAGDRKQDEGAIRATSKQYLAALEKGDAKAATAFWVAGGDIVDPSGRARPASEVLAGQSKGSDSDPKPTVTINSTVRFLTADSAIEDGTADATWQGKDARAPARGHFSAVWVKQQGKWRLASLREGRANSPPPRLGGSELAALDWMSGQWSGQSGDRTFEVSANWNSTHTFLIRELRVVAKGQVVLAANQRIGWDPATQQVRIWTFDSSGSHAEGVLTKEGNAWVARATGTLPDGSHPSFTNTYAFDGKNSMTWKSTGIRGNTATPSVEVKLARKAAAAGSGSASAAGARTAAKSPVDAKKAEVLNSAKWRRAMFELDEWLAAQTVYDKQQIAQMKADLAAEVERASASDLELMLADMDAKFKLLDTPQAQDSRAWLAHYLSILSKKRRDELVNKLPNFATMTAEQLRKELAQVDVKRASMARARQEQDAYQPPTTNPWDPGAQAAMTAYYRDHAADAAPYYSPYRSGPTQRPFSDVSVGQQDFHMYVGAYGGFGLIW